MGKEMRGTLIACPATGKDDPTDIGRVQIEGKEYDVKVYPPKIGQKGTVFKPVKLYRSTTGRIVTIKEGNENESK